MDVAEPHRAGAIIVGLVSDTHGLIRPAVIEALDGVSVILHAGDVGGPDVLHVLAQVAPVHAVQGNIDVPGSGLPDRYATDLGGLSIHMSHGHELGSPTPARLLERYAGDVLVYGHTHRALVHRWGGRLVVNPGAAGPRRFNLRPSLARLTIRGGTAEVEIVEL